MIYKFDKVSSIWALEGDRGGSDHCRWQEVTSPVLTGSDIIGPDRKWHHRKYVQRMRNRKLCNIRPSGALSPEVTSVTWLQEDEEALSGSDPDRKYVLSMPGFSSRFFFLVVVQVPWLPNVTPTSPEAFSHNASLYVIINYPDRWRYYLVTW